MWHPSNIYIFDFVDNRPIMTANAYRDHFRFCTLIMHPNYITSDRKEIDAFNGCKWKDFLSPTISEMKEFFLKLRPQNKLQEIFKQILIHFILFWLYSCAFGMALAKCRVLCNWNCLHCLHSHTHRLALVNDIIISRNLYKLSSSEQIVICSPIFSPEKHSSMLVSADRI